MVPHESKAEQDVVAFLPAELLAPAEDEARELGALAMLRHLAGVPASLPASTAGLSVVAPRAAIGGSWAADAA